MLGDQDGWGTNRLSKAESILGTGMSQNLSRGRRHACVVVSATLKPLLFAAWRRSRWYQSDKLGLHNRIWSNGFNGDFWGNPEQVDVGTRTSPS